jgi:hypothetical protein
MYAVAESKRLIHQVLKDSGKVVRRGYTFPQTSTTTVTVDRKRATGTYVVPPSNSYVNSYCFPNGGRGDFKETLEVTRRVYFKGAYSYHYEVGHKGLLAEIRDLEKKANSLLGIRVTPEVLWNLAPWSWLADWNANIGVNISNAVAFQNDQLVLRWGYLMCEQMHRRTITASGGSEINGPLPSVSVTFTTVTKSRTPATPFGFALNPGSFTDRQWAILAALGMTKAPRALRISG